MVHSSLDSRMPLPTPQQQETTNYPKNPNGSQRQQPTPMIETRVQAEPLIPKQTWPPFNETEKESSIQQLTSQLSGTPQATP